MARSVELLQRGFAVIPCGKGRDGKIPSVRWKTGRPLGVEAFTRKMAETGSTIYGVRLEGMVVLDVDEKRDEVVADLERRYGPASVVVATPRGTHLYYANADVDLPNFRALGIPADVKRGGCQYVIGPGSMRPDGGEYVEQRGRLGDTDLSPLRPDLNAANLGPDARGGTKRQRTSKVQRGMRHRYLMAKAREFVATCESAEELRDNLIAVRDESCIEPASVSDKEVWDIACWTFERFQEGRLYGQNGGFYQVPRQFARQLADAPNALALYSVLRDQHGHKPQATFKLSFAAMKAGGLIKLSERAFHQAKAKLLEVRALEVAKNHQAGVTSREYRLGAPTSSSRMRGRVRQEVCGIPATPLPDTTEDAMLRPLPASTRHSATGGIADYDVV